jgi:hypothetical protein
MNNKGEWAACPFNVQIGGSDPFIIIAKGRDRWALEALIQAGLDGITPIANPAPRVSAYVHRLRRLGVPIETITEPHAGAFAGHHARYVLRATVTRGGGAA